jgi:glyoxylase-like metal-dependent hydrolase (beta-lactamase superfamily II)
MSRAIVLGALVAAGTSLALSGFQGPGKPDAKVVQLQKIKDNLYVATGGGGSSAVFITDLGVVIVDTKLAGWGQPLLAKIKTITDKPVATIINTHAHADHVGSNEFFGTAVEVVAHENTRLTMDKMDAFKGEKVNFLPKLMFRDKMSLGAGRDKIELYYFGPGHTNGDAWVVFPAARVVHAGDMFAGKQPPIIDASMGGSGLAYPDSLEKAFTSIKNVDTIITGHSTLMPWKDLGTYAEFTREFRDVVVNGFDHGLSVSEIADGWTLPARYAGYTAPPDRVKADVQTIVGELTR